MIEEHDHDVMIENWIAVRADALQHRASSQMKAFSHDPSFVFTIRSWLIDIHYNVEKPRIAVLTLKHSKRVSVLSIYCVPMIDAPLKAKL